MSSRSAPNPSSRQPRSTLQGSNIKTALYESQAALRAVLEQNTVGMVLIDPISGYHLQANARFCEMLGYSETELQERTWQSITHPDDIALNEAKMHQLLAGELPNFSLEQRFLTRAGDACWVNLTLTIVRDIAGKPLYSIGILIDLQAHQQAEASLHQINQVLEQRVQERTAQSQQNEEVLRRQALEERILRRVTQEIRQSLNLNDTLATAVTEAQQALSVDRAAIYRFNPDWSGEFIAESVGETWVELVGPDVQKIWEDTYLQKTQGGRYRNHETFAVTDIYTIGHQHCHIQLLEQFQARAYAIAPIFSGDHLWGLLAIYQNAAPRLWEDWEVELLQQIASQLAIAIQQSELYEQLQLELQERRQVEEQLRASLKEKEVLLQEVHHRVKNNIQLVSSLLNLQMDTIADPETLALFSESQQRVDAIALIHERLYRSANLAQINFAAYIRDLSQEIFQSYRRPASTIKLTLEVAEIDLDIDRAIPCGLIINELISNALKYAFPGNRSGEIYIHLSQSPSEQYCLIVRDNGIGIPEEIDLETTTTLGLQLVYGLAGQMGGEIELVRSGGSQFTIRFECK